VGIPSLERKSRLAKMHLRAGPIPILFLLEQESPHLSENASGSNTTRKKLFRD